MSRENVEMARQMIEAWNRRDPQSFAAVFHPDGELLLPRNLLEGGSYTGEGAIDRAFSDAFATWEHLHAEIEDIRVSGDQVVVLARLVQVVRGGGPRVEYESAYLLSFREGKIAYARPYQSHAEALEAVGLRE